MKLLQLPKTVLAAGLFLTILVITGMILMPFIVIPLVGIVVTAASIMRIFYYIVEERT